MSPRSYGAGPMDGPPERFGLFVARETSKEQKLHLKLTNLAAGNAKQGKGADLSEVLRISRACEARN